LFDALVLVAATALGFAVTRSLSDFHGIDRQDSINPRRDGPTPVGHRTALISAYVETGPPPASRIAYSRLWIHRAAFWPCPCVATWTLAILVEAALSPRGPRWRSLRQPGILVAVACVAAFCVAAVEATPMRITWWPKTAPPTFYWGDWWTFTWFHLPRAAGYSVALTWLVLTLSGRWTAARGWLDRLGRFLGLCWIGLAVLAVLGSCLMIV
jgi:hypothetical protein